MIPLSFSLTTSKTDITFRKKETENKSNKCKINWPYGFLEKVGLDWGNNEVAWIKSLLS
jgi:hypothetical protein